MCQSQSVGSYEQAGEMSRMELRKGHEDLCRQESSAIAKMTSRCALYVGACPENFRESLSTPTVTFPEFFYFFLSSFKFFWWAPQDFSISKRGTFPPFKVIQGR